jgi:hypothetical protein
VVTVQVRALLEALSVHQTDAEFNATLEKKGAILQFRSFCAERKDGPFFPFLWQLPVRLNLAERAKTAIWAFI